jgi:predicted TIM-barrel fold metal-dependent hydrolase
VIDDHVHPFPLEFAPLDLSALTLDSAFGEAAAERRRRLAPGRLANELLTTRLAGLLGVPPDELVGERDRIAGGDWPGYVRRLLDDAEVTGMVLDQAVVPEEALPAARFRELAGRPVWELARIEPVLDRALAQGAGAAEVVEAVLDHVRASAAAGCVGFKTVIAYRTGLAVDPAATLAEAERSLDPGVPLRQRGKALRDHLLRVVLGAAAELGLPVQVHTGFGDADLRLGRSHPLLLEDLLRTPEGSAAGVVLIHGAFPFTEEAAHLASTRPNVWVELSLANLFSPLLTADRLLRVLDLAPRDRVLLGSDGHGAPETHWFGCRNLLDAWSGVAARLAEAGARPSWVAATRRALFDDNATELYGLDHAR